MFARHEFEPIRVCSIQGDYANLQWVPPCSSAVWPTHPVHSCRASAGEIERLNNLAPAALASGTTKATWPSATADYGTAVPDTGDNGQTTETGGPWPREAAGHMGKCPGSVAIVIQRNSVNSETPAKPLAPLVDSHIEGRIPAAPASRSLPDPPFRTVYLRPPAALSNFRPVRRDQDQAGVRTSEFRLSRALPTA